MSKKVVGFFLFITLLIVILQWKVKDDYSGEVVNVYGWYGIIPREIFNDFEKETGIKVRYDFYDNNEMLEAKLLSTNNGYDIVFPSFIPYASRQLLMGIYSKLNRKLIPNIKNIDGIITSKFGANGGDVQFLVPLFWGTIGIAYNKKVVSQLLPGETIDSYDVLFDLSKISKLFPYGVSFPEEYIDILPQTRKFLQLKHGGESVTDFQECFRFLEKVRPYITKFSSTTMISDLLSGDVCIAIGASDNAYRAMRSSKAVDKDIQYTLPKKTGILWIDCLGVPKKAPNKRNAYLLINYLLSPEVAAKITNHSGILVNLPAALPLINAEIVTKKDICQSDPEVLEGLTMGCARAENTRELIKAWSQYKTNTHHTSINKEASK
ncbi:MAG: extracellular solute-binding protein [Holosporales bacterium]|jgi:putrescine transport system substrate-binding protein|nr:extracellular solute-binding protein [Holosporales bacterium]